MFDDVYLVDDELQLVDDAEIWAVEKKLGITLPRGYHAFLTTLGLGTYCDWIDVFPPNEIEQRSAELSTILTDYSNWDRGAHLLSRSQIKRSLHIARSMDGDELIFNPETTHHCYVLPRHDDTIYWLSPEFDDPTDWHAEFGSAMLESAFRYFEPTVGRAYVGLFTARTDLQFADVAERIRAALAGSDETRSIIEESYQIHFHKATCSRVQITDDGSRARKGIRISFNPKHEQAVAKCVALLECDGFYVVGGNAAGFPISG